MVSTRDMLLEIASDASVEADGVRFETGAVRFKRLVGGRLPGLRMLLPADVGTARVQLKVDLGYGHPIRPGVETGWFPSLLPGFRSFAMRAYPRETVIGEKLAVAVEFGRDNTCIRDYHDLWFLSRRYGFEGHVLLDAVKETFAERDAGGFLQRRDGYGRARSPRTTPRTVTNVPGATGWPSTLRWRTLPTFDTSSRKSRSSAYRCCAPPGMADRSTGTGLPRKGGDLHSVSRPGHDIRLRSGRLDPDGHGSGRRDGTAPFRPAHDQADLSICER